MDIGQVAKLARAGQVDRITVNGQELTVETDDGKTYKSRKEDRGSVVEALQDLGVPASAFGAGTDQIVIQVKVPSIWTNITPILFSVVPVLLLAGFFIILMRQAQGAGNQAFSFGKSKARVFTGDKPTVTFEDVAGAEEAKQELQEVVEFLKEPQKFASLGARIPKGVLLVGPPGTGKTLMAKAISGEAGVPFFSISGSEFVEMFVGVGASRVRDLFEQAKRNSPCIIFIDEIDAVGRQRGAGLGGSHDEREQTLNQILVEMDGFDTDTNVILIAATNRPDILDPALLRPGRFDRQVVMDRPDAKGREAILKVHVQGASRWSRTSTWTTMAKGTPGFVGADMENLVNEAAILAARRNKRAIGMPEFQEAVERVIAGPERRSRLITDEEKRDRGLSRGRSRPGDADAARTPTRCTRSASSAGAWRSATPCRCRKRIVCCTAATSSGMSWPGCWAAGWPRKRSSATSPPAPATTWSGSPRWRGGWSRSTA